MLLAGAASYQPTNERASAAEGQAKFVHVVPLHTSDVSHITSSAIVNTNNLALSRLSRPLNPS